MIKEAFNKKRPLFVPFIVAGHPTIESSIEAIMALSSVGSDIIELGVPFSDPIADGPTNQKAIEIALKNGMHLEKVLEQVAEVRKRGCTTPILLFTYLNPILAFGYERFVHEAKAFGVDGVLVVDLPPEEGKEFYEMAKRSGLEIVLLASPTTDPKRFSLYKELDPSFLYYISRLSVTGVQKELSSSLQQEVEELRKNMPNTKIGVGFGIATKEQIETVRTMADAVIVGSRLVATLDKEGIEVFRELSREFSAATHGGG